MPPRSAVPAPALEDYDAAAAERMRGVVAAVWLPRRRRRLRRLSGCI
jgi:hypothetical protein